jgi:hypothetical protein
VSIAILALAWLYTSRPIAYTIVVYLGTFLYYIGVPNTIVERLYNKLDRSILERRPYRLIIRLEFIIEVIPVYIYNILKL